jgi:peptidoglycan/LPS O-acetylase OafA/YrhL
MINPIKLDQWSLLAGLRFLLALIVASGHLHLFVSKLGLMAPFGDLGSIEPVLGFLLVSGYSIGFSYIKNPDGFFGRRLRRIYPIYLAAILLTVIVHVVVKHEAFPHLRTLVLNSLFLNNIFTSSYVGPAWSLSLEFWLYCLVPFFFRSSPVFLRFAAWFSFASFVIYSWSRSLFHLPYFSEVTYGGNLLILSFIWICGLRLASPRSDKRSVLREIGTMFALQVITILLIELASRAKHHDLMGFFRKSHVETAMHAIPLLLTFAAFAWLVLKNGSGSQQSTTLRFLGDISYPLYLVHIPVYSALAWWGISNPLLYIGGALGVSTLFYLLLDRYSQRRHLGLANPILS